MDISLGVSGKKTSIALERAWDFGDCQVAERAFIISA
jgi:hypothetical protein